MNERFELNNYIKAYRLLKGMTVKELADFVGVSKSTMRRWENQEATPDIKSGYLIAVALNCEIYDLFTLDRRHGVYGK